MRATFLLKMDNPRTKPRFPATSQTMACDNAGRARASRVPRLARKIFSKSQSFQNRNDTVLKSVLNISGQVRRRREMQNLVRYRAMESLCRQAAVHHPQDSWRLLAEAEMWHHKALEEIASRFAECNAAAAPAALAHTESHSGARDRGRLLAS
jgi:hypothetical protein